MDYNAGDLEKQKEQYIWGRILPVLPFASPRHMTINLQLFHLTMHFSRHVFFAACLSKIFSSIYVFSFLQNNFFQKLTNHHSSILKRRGCHSNHYNFLFIYNWYPEYFCSIHDYKIFIHTFWDSNLYIFFLLSMKPCIYRATYNILGLISSCTSINKIR